MESTGRISGGDALEATGSSGADRHGGADAGARELFDAAVRATPSAPLAIAPLTPPPHLDRQAGRGEHAMLSERSGGIGELVRATSSGRISVQEVMAETFQRIRAINSTNNALISVLDERAMSRARELDAIRERGEGADLPLLGVPVALKDCIALEGVANTCGTAGREHMLATVTAPSVAALENAGAVVVATANLHEWAFGATSRNEAYGAVVNPHGEDRISGGSSGGSAVAVATGMAAVALGTDTGGSIRLPASYCGVAGLKVTTGSVATEGCFPLSWTMDSIGPIAASVADLATPLELLLSTGERTFGDRPMRRLEDLRIGVWPGTRDADAMDAGVRASFLATLSAFEDRGAQTVDIELPDLATVSAAQLAIITSEAAAVHSGPGVDRNSYEENVRELLALGDAVAARDYVNAIRHRQVAWQALEDVFSQVDVIVSPTTPCVAPLVGQDSVSWPDGSSESMLDASIRYLLLWNFVGAPCLSMPCGSSDGLPVGLQLAAPPGSDRSLVRLGVELEAILDVQSTVERES